MEWLETVKESLSVLWIAPWQDTLAMILWAIFLAALLTLGYLLLRRFGLGRAIEALTAAGCVDEGSAKSAEELGLHRGLDGIDRLIERVDGEPPRYYLPQERQKKAEFFSKTLSTKWWIILLEILALYLVLVILYYILPDLLAGF